MEFTFNIEKLLGPVTNKGIVFISGEDELKYSYEELKNINILLDKIGKLSAHVSQNYFSLNLFYRPKNFQPQLHQVINFLDLISIYIYYAIKLNLLDL